MATAADLIKYAMHELGVLGAGKTPTANEQTDCLFMLNAMLETWSNDSLLVPFRTQISHTLDGSTSYTIGSTGDISATRPTYIDSAYVTKNSTDFPVTVLRDRSAYDRISDKDISGTPRFIYYEPTLSDGTLYVYYAGDSTHTLYLNTRGQLTEFTDTTTDIALAPGYKEAIYSNLAISVAPMFEVSVTQETVKKAKDSKSAIKRLNRQIPLMQYDPAIPSRGGYNIEQDG